MTARHSINLIQGFKDNRISTNKLQNKIALIRSKPIRACLLDKVALICMINCNNIMWEYRKNKIKKTSFLFRTIKLMKQNAMSRKLPLQSLVSSKTPHGCILRNSFQREAVNRSLSRVHSHLNKMTHNPPQSNFSPRLRNILNPQ